MYNACFSSAILTLRTKGPLSLSFNEYSNSFYERFDKNLSSSQCCSCCNCCSCSVSSNRVLINSNLCYGLRQSTLIQWSPCKRLIYAARDPYCYRVPNCGPDHSCYDVCCEKSGRERTERRRKDIIGRLKLQKRRCLSSADDAEAVISFLSEEYLGDRDQNGSFRKRVEIEKMNERLSQFESAKSKNEGYRKKEQLEEHKRREEAEAFRKRRTVLRDENYRERKPSSSSSSYYSLSSKEDFGTYKETQGENVGLNEASSNGYNRDSWSREDKFEEVEDFERRGEFVEQKTSTKRADEQFGENWDLRKKTDKKLTEIEETESQRESSRSQSRIARTSGNVYGKLSSSDKQCIREGNEEVTDMNAKRSFQYQSQLIGREEDLKKDSISVEEKRGRYRETVDTSHISGTGNGVKRDAKLQSLSESRMKFREEDIALRSRWELSEKRQQAFNQITDQIESRSASKHFSETSRVNDKDSRKSSSLQSQTGMKNQEGSASFVSHSVEETKEQRSQDVTNVAVNITNVAMTQSTDVETVNYTQVTSGRTTDQGNERVSAVNPIQEARERDNRLNKSIAGVKPREEIHRATEISYFQEQNSGEAINEEYRGYRSSRRTMMPPSRQTVDRGSFRVDLVSGIVTQEVSGETSQSSSGAIYTYSEARTPASIYGEPSNIVYPDDTMVSAQRQEESSEKFVGEYIDMAWNEALTSGISQVNLDHEDVEKKTTFSQSASEGPSDEMWDVTDPSTQEPRKAPKDGEATKNTVVRRSGRSLWGIISDVVRLRWGPRVETPKSTKRSGGKSSSNDSVSSEAWFSGHDPEETSDKNGEKERGKPKESVSSQHQQPIQASVQSHGEKSIIRQLEPSVTSPSTTYISGSTSKGVSSPVEEDRKSLEGTQSLDGKSSLVSLPSSSSSALIGDESHGRGRADVSVCGAMGIKEQPLIAKPTEVLGSEGKDGELKQRKLQRNKQVVKDKFDEWEEAYTREREQRRIDEMFMREALVEAKKAADTWEVPVGAVLVQHGKIIARGYNLVEELRDSAAHAEMICIREASNQLRSWRLAESTLYVTLEPCAMCAGAILQARIDTLVWGAPNKLLGADGSWIRLFPSTEGGDKPASLPHPFHPKMTIRRGILESECADAMQQFFQLRRRKKAKNEDSPPQPSLPIAAHQSKFLRKMHDIFHAFLCL